MAFHVDPVQPWTPVHTVPEWHRNLKSWYVIDLSLAASLDPFPPGGGGGWSGPFTETVPKSPLSGVNKSLVQYGFRVRAKTLRYCMKIAGLINGL